MCNSISKKDVINFSFNWNNKLDNKAFTTIRLHNPNKYRQGLIYRIELKGEFKGRAEMKIISTFRAGQLNEITCYLDTGYNKRETLGILQKMYPDIEIETALIDYCVLAYIKPEPVQEKRVQVLTLAL